MLIAMGKYCCLFTKESYLDDNFFPRLLLCTQEAPPYAMIPVGILPFFS